MTYRLPDDLVRQMGWEHWRGAFERKEFPLGQLLATPGALRAMVEAQDALFTYLDRHAQGDWGEVDREDWQANDRAVREGTRILSAYVLRDERTRIWIITEADRAATTILLPSEY